MMKALNATADDEDWLDALAGAPGDDADPRTLLEATLMRAALQTWASGQAEPELGPVEALLAHARAQGLLPSAPAEPGVWQRGIKRLLGR